MQTGRRKFFERNLKMICDRCQAPMHDVLIVLGVDKNCRARLRQTAEPIFAEHVCGG